MPSPNSNTAPVIVAAFAASRSRSAAPAKPPTILAVDDNRTQIALLEATIEKWGCKSLCAQSGEEALRLIAKAKSNIDLIILDREMPGMDGMGLIARLNQDAAMSGIPVIMLTGNNDTQQLQEEINAGVFYHLVKPADPEFLRNVSMAALRERKQKRLLIDEITRHSGALRNMNSCSMTVRTLREAEDAACLLAMCFPQPIRAVTGFLELLINAVEHGNLGISYEEKTKYLQDNTWHDEIERRLALPEYKDRKVSIAYQRKPDCWVAQITDDGKGFDWRKYWHVDPAHATSSHGRGIPRARLMGFDRVSYNEKGNQVTVTVDLNPVTTLKW